MGRIAHIQLICPQCDQTTDAYIEESEASVADVRCQHCQAVFELGPGMLYKPIGYVAVVPPGAEVSKGRDQSPAPAAGHALPGARTTIDSETSHVEGPAGYVRHSLRIDP